MDNPSSARIRRVTTRVFDYLLSQSHSKTKNEIAEAFPGRRQDKIRAIKYLITLSKIKRVGTGVKGDPYKYRLVLVPSNEDFIPTNNSQGEVIIL